jgi:exonuclease III
MNEVDLTDIYRTFHPETKEYTFFSAPHGTFSKIDHIIGHKTSKAYPKDPNWEAGSEDITISS